MPSSRLTRRSILLAGASSATAIVLAPTVARADDDVPTYALDPTGSSSEKCRAGCAACAACLRHAANKMFATSADAEAGRAHPGCRCTVVDGQPLGRGVHATVFASGGRADRRAAVTASALTAQVEQHSVPMASGVVPVTVLVGGAAGVMWIARRRIEIARSQALTITEK